MQRRTTSRRKALDRHGLAVPIALLALVLVGILVTGAFYALSREPEEAADNATVTTGQSLLARPPVGSLLPEDSMAADSLSPMADTAAAPRTSSTHASRAGAPTGSVRPLTRSSR